MKKSLVVLPLVVASLTAVFGQGDRRPKGRGAADEAAIRALVGRCVAGWNKGSGEAFAAQFAEDSDYVVVNGHHIKGRAQNASGHQQIFDSFHKGTRLWAQVKSVRFLRPDVALMHTVSRVLKPGESDASPEPEAIQTWTVSRHGKEWLVDAFHNTPLQRQGGQAPRP